MLVERRTSNCVIDFKMKKFDISASLQIPRER
jgi:hypothetical protein